MAKNIHQMIISEIDTDQMRVKNNHPSYWNYFSGEKYWLNCLSGEKYWMNCCSREKCLPNGGMSSLE